MVGFEISLVSRWDLVDGTEASVFELVRVRRYKKVGEERLGEVLFDFDEERL